MADYFVEIVIGGHSWSIAHTEDTIPDQVVVLAGLQLGWSLPAGIGPIQGDAMSCTLAINVPSFSDVADIEVGTVVAVGLRFVEADTEPWAGFYGRVSDVQAASRVGRQGVTLSVAAVDYTVDLADEEDWASPGGADPSAKGYVEVITDLWADRPGLGTLPTWPLVDGNGPTVSIGDGANSVAELVKSVLLVAVESDRRVIIAPYVDYTDGQLRVQHYVFDTIEKAPEDDPWEISAAFMDRSTLKWVRNRRSIPGNTLEVSGADGLSSIAVDPDIGSRKVITQRLSTISSDQDELDEVAAFYLSPPEPGTWSLDFANVLTLVLDPTELADLPGDLFPRWGAAPLAPERSSCYGKPVHIGGVPLTENPYGVTSINGALCAASVLVTGGNVRLTTTVRRTVAAPADSPGFSAGAYALTPYAGLETNPT